MLPPKMRHQRAVYASATLHKPLTPWTIQCILREIWIANIEQLQVFSGAIHDTLISTHVKANNIQSV